MLKSPNVPPTGTGMCTNSTSPVPTSGHEAYEAHIICEDEVRIRSEEERHLFIDFSNLFNGARNRDDGTRYQPIVLSAENLCSALGKGKPGRRIVGGSEINGLTNTMGQHLESAGFTVGCFATTPDGKEDGAPDDFLVCQMNKLNATRDRTKTGASTIVLVSGDGNSNGGFACFFDAINVALKNGFRVELYSWTKCMCRKYYFLQENYPDRMKIVLLNSIVQTEVRGAQVYVTLATRQAPSTTTESCPAWKVLVVSTATPVPRPTAAMQTYIFVSNFRVFDSARKNLGASVHINVRLLVQSIGAGHSHVVSRLVKGSVPKPEFSYWNGFTDAGFKHDASPEWDTAEYSNALLALSEKPHPVEMVLVIGGAPDPLELEVMYKVLARGGSVVLWVWKCSVNCATQTLAAQHEGRLHFHYFNNYTNIVSCVRRNPARIADIGALELGPLDKNEAAAKQTKLLKTEVIIEKGVGGHSLSMLLVAAMPFMLFCFHFEILSSYIMYHV